MIKMNVMNGKNFFEETLEYQREWLKTNIPQQVSHRHDAEITLPFELHEELIKELEENGWEYNSTGLKNKPWLLYQPIVVEEAVETALRNKKSKVTLGFQVLPSVIKAMKELEWSHYVDSSPDGSIKKSVFYYDEYADFIDELDDLV